MIRVFLSRQETEWGARIGARRQMDSAEHRRKPKVAFKGAEYWVGHIEGAAAEIAVAKCLGFYCEGSSGTFESIPDLGPYQVRLSGNGKLMIRPDDLQTETKMSRIYIHVVGACPAFTVMGWLRAYEAISPRWVDDPRNENKPIYYVPSKYLYPLDTLPTVEEAIRVLPRSKLFEPKEVRAYFRMKT